MERKKTLEKSCFVMIIIGFLVSSSTVFLIPFASFKENGLANVLAYVIGGGFWIGLLLSIIFLLILNSIRVKTEKATKKQTRKSTKIGLIKIFSNRIATFFDMLFVISLVSQIVIMVLKNTNQVLAITVLFLVAFSFEMHCVFNGRNYLYISWIEK